jgi:uncharacterized membrane protein
MNIIRIIIFIILIAIMFYLYKNQALNIQDNSVSDSVLNSLSNTPFTNSFPSSSSYSISR